MLDLPDQVISTIRMTARWGVSTGRSSSPAEIAYRDRCTWWHPASGFIVALTRDTGHHTGGWWKNPDYERCLHLSLSCREPQDRPMTAIMRASAAARLGTVAALAPFRHREAIAWVEKVLYPDANLSWHEGPYSKIGRTLDVHHFRVFCDAGWQATHPRGEVYSRELTEAGWKSFSDLLAAMEANDA